MPPGTFFICAKNIFAVILKLKSNPMKQKKLKAERREIKKKPKMKVSGKSVFKIREIVLKKAKKNRAK